MTFCKKNFINDVIKIVNIFIIGIYNGLVGLRNRVKNAYAQIDVQLKRRYDLIPNLVETAKGYMKHERETLEAVTEARNQAAAAAKAVAGDPTNAGAMKSLIGAEGALAGSLGRLKSETFRQRTESWYSLAVGFHWKSEERKGDRTLSRLTVRGTEGR